MNPLKQQMPADPGMGARFAGGSAPWEGRLFMRNSPDS